jgi:uncharacterized protein
MPVADRLHPLPRGSIRFRGLIDERIRLSCERHLKVLDPRSLVDWFRTRPDPFAAGEFWGKTVRAACPLYRYTGDQEMRGLVRLAVDDLLATQDADGCISTRSRAQQPLSSDLWERKYVLLGLLAWHEAEGDPRALDAMVRMADHLLTQVGPPPLTRIVDTGWAFAGIESSSILEPMLRLYRLTRHRRYLDFAHYIVEQEGACRRGSIFEAALAGTAPKDIGGDGDPAHSIAKAYESLSCFEGLVEYHRITGVERWRAAALAYHAALREREITIIGSGGGEGPHNRGPGTGEQWNDLALDQADPAPRLMMETCVTVTWMKFCLQLLRSTGNPAFVDDIERSMHNALLGAQHPDGRAWDYFQNLCGTRGGTVNFSADVGGFALSCCTANGPMGLAILPDLAVMSGADGPVVNLYLPGSARVPLDGGDTVRLDIDTAYPRDGRVLITVTPSRPRRCAIALRIPAWSTATTLLADGEAMPAEPGAYAVIDRVWSLGDRIELQLDMRCRPVLDPRGAHQAVLRGPLVLTRDSRLGEDVDEAVDVQAAQAELVTPGIDALVQCRIPTAAGGSIAMIDYASAGATWDARSRFRTWLPLTS